MAPLTWTPSLARGGWGTGESDFYPDLDAFLSEKEFKVFVEVPDVDRESIKVDVVEGNLIVSGKFLSRHWF